MFFRNKFGLPPLLHSDAEVVNDEQAEFIANFGGYNIMAIATVRKTDENGLIQRLTVRPKYFLPSPYTFLYKKLKIKAPYGTASYILSSEYVGNSGALPEIT